MAKPTPDGAEVGKRLRDRGIARTLAANETAAVRLKLAILRRLITDAEVTIDDASSDEQLVNKFSGRGPWRGGTVSGLIGQKLVRVVRFEPSRRQHRRYGWNKVLAAVDPTRLPAAIALFEEELAALVAGRAK